MSDFKRLKSVHEQYQVNVYTISKNSYNKLDIKHRIFPNWIVSYVLKGEVTAGSYGEHYQVRRGDVMIHPPHIPFFEKTCYKGTHCWMSLQIIDGNSLDFLNKYPVYPVVRICRSEEYESLFHTLLNRWENTDGAFRDLGVSAGAASLVALILESWEQAGGQARPSALRTGQHRFSPLIQYMADHLDQKLTRDMLAEQVHLNKNYFDRAFQNAYGITPMQMIREMRLKKVKHLLEATKEPLSSISTACGIGDAAYLSRQFVKSFDMTPGKYREFIQAARINYME